MSAEQNERELSRLIESHNTIKTLVEHFNWSAEAVAKYWEVRIPIAIAFLVDLESDIYQIPTTPKGSKEHKSLPTDELVKAYSEMQTLEKLAERYHVSVNTIKNRLKKAGVMLRGTGKQKVKVDYK